MTVIVGVTDDDCVYLGGDRAASDGTTIVSLKNPKVYKDNYWVYGYAGTIGIGQLINDIEFPDVPPDDDPYIYIRNYIVPSMKDAIEYYSREGTEHDTAWLIGCHNHLYEMYSADWSIAEVYESAIGSGNHIALGSLYTSSEYTDEGYTRIELALNAAITYSPMCRGPYDIVCT